MGAGHCLLDDTRYDRSPSLTDQEAQALAALVKAFDAKKFIWPPGCAETLQRVVQPLEDVMAVIQAHPRSRVSTIRLMIRHMQRSQSPFWGWDDAQWAAALRPAHSFYVNKKARYSLLAFAYVLGGVLCFPSHYQFDRYLLACGIFGKPTIDDACQRVCDELFRWGYDKHTHETYIYRLLCESFLVNRSPRLEDLPAALCGTAMSPRCPNTPIASPRISRACCSTWDSFISPCC